jgi:hypothetical protein
VKRKKNCNFFLFSLFRVIYYFFLIKRIQLKKIATEKGLINSIVCDAGRTQIAAGSRTVLGIGPGFM